MRILKRAIVASVVVAWAFFAFSPSGQASAGPPEKTPEGVAVNGDAAIINGDESLAVPTELEIVGEHLVLVDRRAERPLHIVNSTTGELVRSLGTEGDGPGEYRGLRSVSPVPGSGTAFWAYDVALSRLTYVDITDEVALERPWEAELITLHSNARVTGIEFLGDEGLVAAGFFPEGRLGLFAADGDMIGAVGELPSYEYEVPAPVLQHAYMGTLKAHPARKRLAIGLRHASSIEIRGPRGNLVATTELEKDSFEPKFEVANTDRGPMMSSDETLRFGYIDVAVTSERIYGLFSGRTRAAFPGRANFGEQIHVFDWSGNLIDVLEVEEDLIAIAVESDDSRLYGVRHDPAPAVLSWQLDSETILASR